MTTETQTAAETTEQTQAGTATQPADTTQDQNPGAGADQQPKPEDNPSGKETTGNLPESADAYEVQIDGFDFSEFAQVESNKAFLEQAHAAGITNEQLSVVMQAYEQHTAVHVEALQTEWGGEFNQNVQFAQQAVKASGLSMEDVDSPTFGLKLAAYFGKQLQEDLPPANTQENSGADVQSLMKSEAYLDSKHPEHEVTYKKVQDWYQKQHK